MSDIGWTRCRICKSGIINWKGETPKKICSECDYIERTDELHHTSMVRCPECKKAESVHDWEGELYEEGTHEIYCGECGVDYSIETNVEWTFTSPKLKEENGDAERSPGTVN